MKDELLLLIKEKIDTLINQTKPRPQEFIENKQTKSKDTFSLNKPLEIEEGKRMLGVLVLETYRSVFNATKNRNRFAIYTPGHWEDAETIKKAR